MSFLRRKKSGGARKRAKQDMPAWLAQLASVPWKRLAPAGVMAVVAFALAFAVRIALDRPVQQVAISGRFQRVQPPDVEKAVRGALHGDGMVAVNLDRIASAVEQIPWIDRVSVARSWPNGLTVQVVEQKPVARWGENGLVNTRGELFVHDAQHIPAELPELVGPTGYEAEMTQRLLAAQSRLELTGMRLKQLSLDERGAWSLLLDNGIALRLGRDQVDARFERFLAAAARIVAPRAADIAYVDMRYANGFAIGWRTGASGVQRG
jgi:cell division protein FtsQ